MFKDSKTKVSTIENVSTSVNAKVISLNVSLNVLWNISLSLPRIFNSIISSWY